MSKANIPIFIAHRGCQNNCVFCNQKRITGTIDDVTPEKARQLILEGLSYMNRDTLEIAFFGGSFTGIPIDSQTALLSAAKEFVDNNHVTGIRISTRPDYISDEILDNLKRYSVTSIELGAQSMDDSVLALSKRGHSSIHVVNASEMIKSYGFELGLQMMTGLPGSSDEKDLYTCNEFIKLRPKTVRIYPTLVLKDTYLNEMYENGEYIPEDIESAVMLSAKLYDKFDRENIDIIRVGLQPSKSLEESFVAGPYHPSFGEMAQSRVIYNRILEKINNYNLKEPIITSEKRFMSKLIGQKRENMLRFERELGYVPKIIEGGCGIHLDEYIIWK
ncbi:MAG: radical SAM protein [Bacillota bacterium]|nr:radical SAM protein [Bacillota bacterium]